MWAVYKPDSNSCKMVLTDCSYKTTCEKIQNIVQKFPICNFGMSFMYALQECNDQMIVIEVFILLNQPFYVLISS